MKTGFLAFGAVVALAACGASAADQSSSAANPMYGQRNVLPLDGTWTSLDETIGVGGFFSGPWSYTSGSAVQLDVTDIFVVTDAFSVYVDGNLVGSTAILPDYFALGVDPFGTTFQSDPNLAWTDPNFSKGSFLLPAGTHDVTFQSIYIPTGFGDSTIAFRANVIPAPAAAGLAGLAGLAAFRRRR